MKYLSATIILFSVAFHFASAQCISHKVTSIALTNQTGCSATVNWTPAPNTSYFEVSKKLKSASQWSAPINVGYTTSYTFSNLKLNKKYSFRVTAYCSIGAIGKSKDIVQQQYYSTPPTIVVSECIFPQQIHVKWQPCNNSSYNRIQTRRASETTWTDHFTGPTPEFYLTVTGVEPVQYRITSCIDTTQGWTSVNTIYLAPTSTGHKPNIITIMLDDARFDAYSCNGPSSVPLTPNIDRIANEGVNFKNSYVVYSLCDPSRATLFTGLYPHHHGTRDNVTMYYSYLPTVAKTLDTAGYYTAMIGKFLHAVDNNPLPQPGWNYWMAHYKSIDTNPKFMFNDSTLKQINGNINDIVTDTAVKIIQSVNTPFYIDLNYATHPPYHADPQDDSLYQYDNFPLPDNYYKFSADYPDFVYPMQLAVGPDTLEQQYRDMYEVIHTVDVNIGRVFDALEASGKLDSTLILLTSDNGYMMGEHYLEGKRMTYNESARVPIFLRYPAWFVAGSQDENDFALNTDLAATLLDAAGIPNAFPTDGISLRRILYDQDRREKMYYEVTNVIVQLANARSVFSKDYVYNYYYCGNTTEEFFDLTIDPEENTNRINYSSYQSLIQQYRNLKDSFKTALTDTVFEEIHSCHLVSGNGNRLLSDESLEEGSDLKLFPNPADEMCSISFPEYLTATARMTVTNSMGAVIQKISLNEGIDHIDLETKNFTPDLYFIRVSSANIDWKGKMNISR